MQITIQKLGRQPSERQSVQVAVRYHPLVNL